MRSCNDAGVPQLVLVRHAKSSWDDPSLRDEARPLSGRGRTALSRMSDHVSTSVPPPDVVLLSPAQRTVETLEGIRPALPPDVRIDVVDEIYGAGSGRLLRLVTSLGDDVACAMLVGHNPGLQDLATMLVERGDPVLRRQLWAKFPTGSIATLAIDVPWADLAPSTAELRSLFMPRRPRS